MKINPLKPLLVIFAAVLCGASATLQSQMPAVPGEPVYADLVVGSFGGGWIGSIVNGNVTSITQAVPLGDLGYFNLTVSTTGSSWGEYDTGFGTYALGPSAADIDPSWVHPDYQSWVPGLTALAIYGPKNELVNINMDFSTLEGGFLPAGSVIAYNDVDGLESAQFIGEAGWYSLNPESLYQLGINMDQPWGTEQPLPGPDEIPSTLGSTATTLFLSGTGRNTDGVTNFIVTQMDLTSLQIVAAGSPNLNYAQALAVGYDAALVPEPSSALLIFGSALLLPLFRRQRDPL